MSVHRKFAPPIGRLLQKMTVALVVLAWLPAAVAEPTRDITHRPAANARRLGVQVKIETFTVNDATAIRQSGFTFVRFGVWSNYLHDPVYRKRVSAAFASADSAGLPVLVTMRSTQPLPGDLSLETAGEQFASSVNEIEQNFGPQILAIELWNEPDLGKYWPVGNVLSTFGPFMRGACSQLGIAKRAVPVFGFGFSRAPSQDSVPDSLLRTVMRESPTCLDAVSYHAYGTSPEEIRNIANDIKSRYGLPTVITEWGVPSDGTLGGIDGQANRIGSFVESMNRMNTELVSIYEWKDTLSGNNARERSYGLVSASGAPKAALAKIRNSIREFSSSPATGTNPTGR